MVRHSINTQNPIHALVGEMDQAFNEADTCRKYVVPKLVNSNWDKTPYSFTEQRSFTDGRIIPLGGRMTRGQRKRADYLLRYTHDFNIAVVEAKANLKLPADGLQQAKEYAEILDLKFAYATNGKGIVEFDYFTGKITELESFPTPDDLWYRYAAGMKITTDKKPEYLTPYDHTSGKNTRYYQEIAINRTVQAILKGQEKSPTNDGHRHRQDLCCLPDLLEVMEISMEPSW